MKTTISPSRRLVSAAIVIGFAFTTAVPSGWGAAAKTTAEADRESRPALQVKIDREPIDRSAADRVSYAPIVEKSAAPSAGVYALGRSPLRRPRY